MCIHRCSPGGGAGVRAGGCPGVLLNLSALKCQWDGPEKSRGRDPFVREGWINYTEC